MRRRAVTIAASLALFAVACSSTPSGTRPAGGPGTIVVGVSGAFTENQLVAEMYAQVLEHAGYTVQRQFDLTSREVSQNALESGQIDLKPEYLSSLLLFLNERAEASNDPGAVADRDRELLGSKGISLLEPSPAQDTNVFVANAQTAQTLGLTSMTSLAAQASHLMFGGPPECPQRPYCLAGLKTVYGIVFDDFVPLDAGGPQTVEALKSGRVQIGLLFSTDPSIRANGFVPLVDDRRLQNAENLTPVIRTDKLDDEVRAALDGVSAKLDTENVTSMVGKVTVDGEDIATVAHDFLAANGLV